MNFEPPAHSALPTRPVEPDSGFDTRVDATLRDDRRSRRRAHRDRRLVPRDRLASARGRAGTGSLAEALAGRRASPPRRGRAGARAPLRPPITSTLTLRARLARARRARSRCGRCSASSRCPSSRAGDRLRVAVADPANIHGIDELRLATQVHDRPRRRESRRHPRRARARSRACPRSTRRSRRSTRSRSVDEEDDDLEAEDGVSDAPLVRLVNSIIMQAADDGASDIHFEPQEDALARPRPRRRRAHRGAADPEADGERRHDPPQGAREARHRRAPQAAGRPHLARTPARSVACSTSASRCCRRSKASRSSCA